VLEDRRWNQWLRDEIAPSFVEAFLPVLAHADWQAEAHRFLPTAIMWRLFQCRRPANADRDSF